MKRALPRCQFAGALPKEVLRQPIDWQRVNAIHEAERRRGLDFLRSNLYDGASPDEQG